jgi:toxin secretion/phage lysis holin
VKTELAAILERIGVRVLLTVAAVIGSAIGGWGPSMTALVILMVADFVSGWVRAFEQHDLSSQHAGWGTAKKVIMIGVVIVVAYQLDKVAGSGAALRDLAILFYCASEGLSIVENAVACGLPVPEALKSALAQLNEKKYVAK